MVRRPSQASAAIALLSLVVLFLLRKQSVQNVKLVVQKHDNDKQRTLWKGLNNLDLQAYSVPLAFNSSLVQLCFLFFQWTLQKPIEPDFTESLRLPEGENVFLDWFLPKEVNPTTPIVVYLFGITGTTQEAASFVRRVTLERKWIVVLFHRRGHMQPLKTPEFNLFGNARDLHLALQSIRASHPLHPIALVGSSAGSALLVRYLGEFSQHSMGVICGVALSPGYDIHETPMRIQNTVLDRYLLRRIKSFFLLPNTQVLREKDAMAVDRMETSVTLAEFCKEAAVFAHHQETYSYSRFLENTCPLQVKSNVCLPLLCVNALDDPICVREIVEQVGCVLPFQNAHMALVTTENGSHCAHFNFFHGIWKPENWGYTLALDFIQGVLD